MVWKDRGGVDSSVMSWAQVRSKLRPLGSFANSQLFCFEAVKYDFAVFFMNAPQEQVLASVGLVTSMGNGLWGSSRCMRLVRKQSRPTYRALGQRMVNRSTRWHSPCGVGVVVRRLVNASDSLSVPLCLARQALRVDLLTPLKCGEQVFRQTHGLAIGSPWGGCGCRLWTQACEGMSSGWRAYLWRKYSGGWVSPRWVDDRWVGLFAATRRGVHVVAGGEALQFAPGKNGARLALWLLSRLQWAPDDAEVWLTVRPLVGGGVSASRRGSDSRRSIRLRGLGCPSVWTRLGWVETVALFRSGCADRDCNSYDDEVS